MLRKIEMNKYKLPLEDDSIDFLFSGQVFEHVIDYPTTLAEIQRVLKPYGFSLHDFPSRYKVIEPHVYFPFASIVKNKTWLTFWAYLGIKYNFQKGMPAKEVAGENYHFLTNLIIPVIIKGQNRKALQKLFCYCSIL